ncbi:MAG: NAD(P)-dependent oxidoreductase [Bacteroidales bacterium]|nr:NAD(P)-dependent oxidoreductase [Bacteroidales bacterium]
MKIGLIKETKIPIDNRVALTPQQMAQLQKSYPDDQFVVQSSPIRAYTDEEYRQSGIQVCDDIADCDILFGIKEASIPSLIPDKHYFFFGHIAKMQAYNKPLLQAMMAKRITFSDYEYLTDSQHKRVCAFGWWAGIVGVYHTLRCYGLKYHTFTLPAPDKKFSLEQLTLLLCNIVLPKIKILITGTGRVSQGAQYILQKIGAKKMSEQQFLNTPAVDFLSYCVADAPQLVEHCHGKTFNWDTFNQTPQLYRSIFMRWAVCTDMLICAHFWAPDAPVYLSEQDLKNPNLSIKVIGDITCDIQGSIKSTLRATTHDEPYYDYNPITGQEMPPFSLPDNISVMAIDTCPNALAMDTSDYFGQMLMQHVFPPLLNRQHSNILQRGTILQNGQLTPLFRYLDNFSKS